MKHTDYVKEFLLLALLLGPMVYLALIWNQLPASIPTNFNINGEADGVVRKSEFLLLMIFLFFTNALLYALFRYIPKRETWDETPDEFRAYMGEYYRIRFRIHIYLAVFTAIVIFLISRGKEIFVEKWVFVGVGLLIAALGVFLRHLKPNYFVGVRTPWTLASDAIWTETHHMAGRLWLYAGIVIMVAGMFLPVISGVFLFIFAAMALAALPYIYSYRLFYKTQG